MLLKLISSPSTAMQCLQRQAMFHLELTLFPCICCKPLSAIYYNFNHDWQGIPSGCRSLALHGQTGPKLIRRGTSRRPEIDCREFALHLERTIFLFPTSLDHNIRPNPNPQRQAPEERRKTAPSPNLPFSFTGSFSSLSTERRYGMGATLEATLCLRPPVVVER
jgi:hypothetical protein